MRATFLIIAGPTREEMVSRVAGFGIQAPVIIHGQEFLDTRDPAPLSVVSLVCSLIESFGGVDQFNRLGHRIIISPACYPSGGPYVETLPWLRLLDRDLCRQLTNERDAIRLCGRPLTIGEICCYLTHRHVLGSISRSIVAGNLQWILNYDPTVDPLRILAKRDYENITNANNNSNHVINLNRDEVFVVLEDDAVPLWTLQHLPDYCSEMKAAGFECSLLHGGDLNRSRKSRQGKTFCPRPLRGVKRYGAYSMVFTRAGIWQVLDLLSSTNGRVNMPVDDQFMASGLFAVPDIPMFSHDNTLGSTLATERLVLQKKMRRGDYR